MASRTEMQHYPGAAKIEYVIHDNGTLKSNITLFATRIDIHSDVNIIGSQCYVQVTDYENLFEKLQFSAGDAVVIGIKENSGEYQRRYKVRRISDISNLDNGRVYHLHLVSELEYASYHVKVSRYYIGKSDEVAQGVLDNYTKEGGQIWEPSVSQVEFISPNWSPIKLLKWIASKSRSNLSPTSFVFFQNSKQFWNFTSLPFLRKENKQVPTYRYMQDNRMKNGTPDSVSTMFSIQTLKYYDSFDIHRGINQGNVMATDYVHDFTTKQFQIWKNSYWDTYKDNSLNKYMSWKQEEMDLGKVTISQKVTEAMSLTKGYSTPHDEIVEDLAYPKTQQIEITVYGNNVVDIGQLINIEIPAPQPAGGRSVEIDRVWSGVYYVVSKHDAYDKTGHTMALRLAKDSFI